MKLFIIAAVLQDILPARLKIGLKLKAIKQETRVTCKDQLKELHVQCNKKFINHVQAELKMILGSTETTRPVGVKLRFIPVAESA